MVLLLRILLPVWIASLVLTAACNTSGGGNGTGTGGDTGRGATDRGGEIESDASAAERAQQLATELRSDDETVRRSAVTRTSAAEREVQSLLLAQLESDGPAALAGTETESLADAAARRQWSDLAARWYSLPPAGPTTASDRERRLVAAVEQWIAAEEWRTAYRLATLRPAGPYSARTEQRLAELRDRIEGESQPQ